MISLRLDPNLIVALREFASRHGMSLSDAVRRAVTELLGSEHAPAPAVPVFFTIDHIVTGINSLLPPPMTVTFTAASIEQEPEASGTSAKPPLVRVS
jgi:plasmid stability protein